MSHSNIDPKSPEHMAGQSDPQVTSSLKTEVEKIWKGKTGETWQALESTILSPLLKEALDGVRSLKANLLTK